MRYGDIVSVRCLSLSRRWEEDALLAVPLLEMPLRAEGGTSGSSTGINGDGGCGAAGGVAVRVARGGGGAGTMYLVEASCDLRGVCVRTGDRISLRVVGGTTRPPTGGHPPLRSLSLCAEPLEPAAMRRVCARVGRRGEAHVIELLGIGPLRTSSWLARRPHVSMSLPEGISEHDGISD